MSAQERLLAHLDHYWDIAYQEGREGRNHDTEDGIASLIRHSIESEIEYLSGFEARVKVLEEELSALRKDCL